MKSKPRLNLFLLSMLLLLGNSQAYAALIFNSPQPITHTVTIQPIIVSDGNLNPGGNTATFFGNPTEQGIIEGFIDNIWAQAGIDVNFLSHNSWNNTFANWGSGGAPNNGGNIRQTSDLNTIVDAGAMAGVTNTNPNVINLFFVNIAAGFGILSPNSVAGLAFVGGNGITQYVGSALPSFTGGQETIASVVAHEIGHNLGLPHLVEIENLMQVSSSPNQGEKLNLDQIRTALASNLSVTAVPLPAAFWFFGSGLFGLIGLTKVKLRFKS